jgi:hypothetical protein
MRNFFKGGQEFGQWILVSYLGGGGNGEVWKCKNKDGKEAAIKILKKIKEKAYARFADETSVIEKNADIEGILPILDKHLPNLSSGETPFYVMPIAEPAEDKLRTASIEKKIEAIVDVAEILLKLHKRGISHRDIKPPNILFYKSRFVPADFGLVDFPDKQEVSSPNEEIGAKWTMAPEMRRESSKADGQKADVYSLAKTLWILITGYSKGFDGQYSADSILELKRHMKGKYSTPIDNLLIKCTDNDPQRRPTIEEFINALKKWEAFNKSFHERNINQWFEIQSKLFPISIPQRAIWEDPEEILKVLKMVCAYKSLNHVFFPDRGGLDLDDVKLAYEKGCLELDFGSPHIIKPQRLVLESFGSDPEWNYFRLELAELTATDVHGDDPSPVPYDKRYDREKISELSPGNYYPSEVLYDFSYGEDYFIPESSRHIQRWFRGCFLILCKRSWYNLSKDTYDGRHNGMATDNFREYVQKLIYQIKKIDEQDPELDPYAKERQKRYAASEKMEHLVVESPVYRCGWCGKIVDSKGEELPWDSWKYCTLVVEKFGDGVVSTVTGDCCKARVMAAQRGY